MNLDRNISSTQIIWAVGLLLGLGLAAYIGSAVGSQDLAPVALIIGASAAIGTFLFLGKDYWMLIPLSLGANFPAIPLGGRAIEFPELAIAACTVFFIIRVATRKEKLQLLTATKLPFLVFMAWVGIVFVLNPIGLAMMGASIGGGRFYVKLALAFAAFAILSSRTYTDRDIKWVIGFLIFGSFFSMFYSIATDMLVGPAVDPTTGLVKEEFYSWHQEMGAPALTMLFLVFARWSPREIFSIQRLLLPLVCIVCVLMVLLSGKRMALAAVFIAPLVGAVIYRQFIYIFLGGLMALGSLSILVAGQGQWFTLPLVAQRTLSWLPGDWDPELEYLRGGKDDWRAELRFLAKENIKRDPIIGRGFAVDISETITAVGMKTGGGGVGMDAQVASYALGRAWHNTWLGYAADFGIPLSIMQGIIYLTVLILSLKCFRFYGNRSLLGVFALYVLMFTARDLVASHTSGHSASDAFARWWMYGIVVAIYAQMLAAKTASRHSLKSARLRRPPVPMAAGGVAAR